MRRLFAIALLFVAACGTSPSAPSQQPVSPPFVPAVFADFAGYWSGTFHYTACVGLHCSARVDRNDPFSLRLRQTINHVTGVFASENTGNIEISGDVQPDGSLVLSGLEETGGRLGLSGRATFAAPALRLDPVTGLAGTMKFARVVVQSPLDSYTSVADGSVVSAVRQSLDTYIADLGGTWKGLYRVDECVEETTGRPLCGLFNAGEVENLELTFSVGGTTAAGEVIPISIHIPVAGTASGRTIELAGTRVTLDGKLTDRINGLSASVDEYGRLKGSFAYARVFNGVSQTAKVELLQVVRLQ
jgi:hypothetical protein